MYIEGEYANPSPFDKDTTIRPSEFRCAEGLRTKVEELLRGLLGGISEESEGEATVGEIGQRNAEDRSWDNATNLLCGWSRKELLKGVILILGKYLYASGDGWLTRRQGGIAICNGSRYLMRIFSELQANRTRMGIP